MRAGEFPDGSRVLRAKIDMASPNMNLRDPVMYRINARAPPHRRRLVHLPDVRLGPRAVDSIEGITHSLCTLEFELTTARSTTGSSIKLGIHPTRSRSSSPGST
jgi:glutaminyl-tRNA synthetase